MGTLRKKVKEVNRKEAGGKFFPPRLHRDFQPIVKFAIFFLFVFLVIINESVMLSFSGTDDVSEYTIGATDVLQVTVWGQDQLGGTAPVRPDGKITIPLLGDIQAAGLTPTALSNEISQKLGKYLKGGTQVSVAVVEFNSQTISILGQVSRPGKLKFPIIPSMMEVLTEAGGPLPTADLSAVKIFPKEQSRRAISVDLDAALKGENTLPLPQLHIGDTIYIPPKADEAPSQESTAIDTIAGTEESTSEDDQAPIVIDVLGQVSKPGRLEFKKKPTIVEVLNQAGGAQDSFLLQKIRVIRGDAISGGMIVVDVKKFLETGDYSILPELNSGDIIYVPEANLTDKMKQLGISISGRVANPGNYPISAPIGLLEALGMAGGLQPDANSKKIKITREATGALESKIVDISKLLQQKGAETSTIVVQPGDAIFVPPKDSKLINAANITRSIATFLRDAILVYSAYRIITQESTTQIPGIPTGILP